MKVPPKTLHQSSNPSHDNSDQSEKAEESTASAALGMNYGDYLKLDQILSAQACLSPSHDEMLFIIQHQTSELWMKLALHELAAARKAIIKRELPQAFKMLARISRIFEQLNSAWDVLRTLTPTEYHKIRPYLGESSGFQSWQYRLIEYGLGNRNHAMLAAHRHRPHHYQSLIEELAKASLYDIAIDLLHDSGFELSDTLLRRDRSQTHLADQGVMLAWQTIYRQPEDHWNLYQLAEKMIDLEDYFRRWRFNHVTTVERIIGAKIGTGGTSGVSYLRNRLSIVLFPELWQVRSEL